MWRNTSDSKSKRRDSLFAKDTIIRNPTTPKYEQALSDTLSDRYTGRGSRRKLRTPRTLTRLMQQHRDNERTRHRGLNTCIVEMSKRVPGYTESSRDTKIVKLQRVINYICHLENHIQNLCMEQDIDLEYKNLFLSPHILNVEKKSEDNRQVRKSLALHSPTRLPKRVTPLVIRGVGGRASQPVIKIQTPSAALGRPDHSVPALEPTNTDRGKLYAKGSQGQRSTTKRLTDSLQESYGHIPTPKSARKGKSSEKGFQPPEIGNASDMWSDCESESVLNLNLDQVLDEEGLDGSLAWLDMIAETEQVLECFGESCSDIASNAANASDTNFGIMSPVKRPKLEDTDEFQNPHFLQELVPEPPYEGFEWRNEDSPSYLSPTEITDAQLSGIDVSSNFLDQSEDVQLDSFFYDISPPDSRASPTGVSGITESFERLKSPSNSAGLFSALGNSTTKAPDLGSDMNGFHPNFQQHSEAEAFDSQPINESKADTTVDLEGLNTDQPKVEPHDKIELNKMPCVNIPDPVCNINLTDLPDAFPENSQNELYTVTSRSKNSSSTMNKLHNSSRLAEKNVVLKPPVNAKIVTVNSKSGKNVKKVITIIINKQAATNYGLTNAMKTKPAETLSSILQDSQESNVQTHPEIKALSSVHSTPKTNCGLQSTVTSSPAETLASILQGNGQTDLRRAENYGRAKPMETLSRILQEKPQSSIQKHSSAASSNSGVNSGAVEHKTAQCSNDTQHQTPQSPFVTLSGLLRGDKNPLLSKTQTLEYPTIRHTSQSSTSETAMPRTLVSPTMFSLSPGEHSNSKLENILGIDEDVLISPDTEIGLGAPFSDVNNDVITQYNNHATNKLSSDHTLVNGEYGAGGSTDKINSPFFSQESGFHSYIGELSDTPDYCGSQKQ